MSDPNQERRDTCWVCNYALPAHKTKFCSHYCECRRAAWGKRSRKGDPFLDFVERVERPFPVAATPAKQAKAEEYLAKGALVFRDKQGLIRLIGKPLPPGQRSPWLQEQEQVRRGRARQAREVERAKLRNAAAEDALNAEWRARAERER